MARLAAFRAKLQVGHRREGLMRPLHLIDAVAKGEETKRIEDEMTRERRGERKTRSGSEEWRRRQTMRSWDGGWLLAQGEAHIGMRSTTLSEMRQRLAHPVSWGGVLAFPVRPRPDLPLSMTCSKRELCQVCILGTSRRNWALACQAAEAT